MAIISDIELTAGFQVVIRWFARGSQRYPANENDFYETFKLTLEPNEQFFLEDPRFVLADINEIPGNLEYVIRDICHVKTLIPSFVGRTFFQPDYRELTNLSAAANAGDTTISVADASGVSVNANIQIGPIQSDVRIVTAKSGDDLTLNIALTKSFPNNESVNQANFVLAYPADTGASIIERIVDNDGNLLTDPIQVTQPIFFDESETVRRYYYTSTLDTPFNGARGSGNTTDMTIDIGGDTYTGGWWAFGDEDNKAADTAIAVDNMGFEIMPANGSGKVLRGHGFQISLAYGDGQDVSCLEPIENIFLANHSNFIGVGPLGTTSIRNLNGTVPKSGYYSWESSAADNHQRYVKFWDSVNLSFTAGIVGSGTSKGCPSDLMKMTDITTYASENNLACRQSGSDRTVWFETVSGDDFGTLVTGIWTNRYGVNSTPPSAIGATFIQHGDNNFYWSGSALTASTASCSDGRYCADPAALNTGSGTTADNTLCVYARSICTDATATNYIAPADRRATDREFSTAPTCTYPAGEPGGDDFDYSASYNVDLSGLTAPSLGYTLTTVSDEGNSGDGYTISWEFKVNDQYRWTSTVPTTLSDDTTGTFASSDVVIDASVSGTIEEVPDPVKGCNTEGAANYTPGSDGTVTCYYGPMNYRSGASSPAACANDTDDTEFYFTSDTTTPAVDATAYTDSSGTASTASKWYANAKTTIQLTDGVVVKTDVCKDPPELSNETIGLGSARAGDLEVNGQTTVGVGDSLSAFWSFDATVERSRTVTISLLGISDGDSVIVTSNTSGKQTVTFPNAGYYFVSMRVTDTATKETLAYAISKGVTVSSTQGSAGGFGT